MQFNTWLTYFFLELHHPYKQHRPKHLDGWNKFLSDKTEIEYVWNWERLGFSYVLKSELSIVQIWMLRVKSLFVLLLLFFLLERSCTISKCRCRPSTERFLLNILGHIDATTSGPPLFGISKLSNFFRVKKHWFL